MIVLKNSELEVHLHPKGAEIHKIIGLKDQMNYMWKRDFTILGKQCTNIISNRWKSD